MGQRKVAFATGEFYHIYNRGNSKQVIFKDDADYVRFQQLLYVVNSAQPITLRLIRRAGVYTFERKDMLVSILAYCLMPNHFHIVITPKREGGVQQFMQKLSTAYSMYFNKRYERTGGLFEGRFKSQHLNSDEYLKYIFSYVHLNPVKLIQPDWREVGITDVQRAYDYLGSYKFSSYLDYKSVPRSEQGILDKAAAPAYFPDEHSFEQEILEWLTFDQVQGPALN